MQLHLKSTSCWSKNVMRAVSVPGIRMHSALIRGVANINHMHISDECARQPSKQHDGQFAISSTFSNCIRDKLVSLIFDTKFFRIYPHYHQQHRHHNRHHGHIFSNASGYDNSDFSGIMLLWKTTLNFLKHDYVKAELIFIG